MARKCTLAWLTMLSATFCYQQAVGYDICQYAPSAPECQAANTPPTAPANVTSTPVSPVSLRLAWSKSTDDKAVTLYKIYRARTVIGTVTDGTSFEVTNLSSSSSDNYSVEACDADNACTASASVVGTPLPTNNPVYPSVTVSDQTKAVIKGITFFPAGNAIGVRGAVYVAAIINGSVLFLDSTGSWTALAAGKSPPAYFVGDLTSSIDLSILPTATDLTRYKGAQILVGYGKGIAPLSDPFNNMLTNATYDVIYTVK